MPVPPNRPEGQSPIGKVLRSFRNKGVRETLRLLCARSYSKYRDWRLRIRTSDRVDRTTLGYEANLTGYLASNYRILDVVFAYLNPNPRKDVLLDYGSGRGRVVVLAATHPFLRVIGIELSSDLAAASRRNIERAEKKLTCPVEIITVNAVNFDIPEDVNVIFLFNPFKEDALHLVQQRIEASLRMCRRPLRIIYLLPHSMEDTFAHCPWLEREDQLRIPDSNRFDLRVYRAIEPPVSHQGNEQKCTVPDKDKEYGEV